MTEEFEEYHAPFVMEDDCQSRLEFHLRRMQWWYQRMVITNDPMTVMYIGEAWGRADRALIEDVSLNTMREAYNWVYGCQSEAITAGYRLMYQRIDAGR